MKLHHLEAKNLRFSVFSSKNIRSLSVAKIVTPLLFDPLGHALPVGLYDAKMGPFSINSDPCATCYRTLDCNGHMGHIELSMLVYNPIFVKIVHDILRITCFNCFRLQISDNITEILVLQLRLLDAGFIVEAQDIEIFKSDVVLAQTKEDGNPKLNEYRNLLATGLNSCDVAENTKNLEALRTSIVSSSVKNNPNKRCIHCKEALKKVKFSFKKLMLTASKSDFDSDFTFDFDSDEDISIDSRIINGKDAARGQFPYYVYLQVQMPQGLASCGGSLISNQWVLTAGHCLDKVTSAKVHLGSLKVKEEKEPGRFIIDVAKEGIFRHPKYFMPLILNDIGLIKLPKPVEFSDTIKPVKLACSSTKNIDVIAIGNGLTHDSDKTLAPTLQYTNLRTQSILKCLPFFPQLLFRKSVICVTGTEKHSSCRGDSGGPLVTAEGGVLVGLTSFGSRFGCEIGLPQGFTLVASYLPWIKKVSGISECV